MKTMKTFSRRIAALLLVVTVGITALAPAASASSIQLPSLPKDQCVVDDAGVLSDSTTSELETLNAQLSSSCDGAQIGVLTVDYTGNATKLSAEFQMGEAVMLFTDTRANDYIMASETLTDLSEKYPGHENIQKDGYYLRHTDFATKIDYPGNVDRDLAISLRKPVKTSDSKEKMQETYDVAEKVFLRIMDDLDNTTEPEDIVTTEPETTAVTTVTTAKED